MDRQIDGHGRNYPGLFIAVIGPDGAGKSTLCHSYALFRGLRKYYGASHGMDTYHPTHSPSKHTDLGRLCRETFSICETTADYQRMALMMAAEKIEWYDAFIKPYLTSGGIVICDRWAACSGAYQGVTPELHGYILSINQPVPHPDFTVYLRMDDVEELARRAGCGVDNEHATVERLTAIQQRYEDTMGIWQHDYTARLSVTVDGMTPDEVAERVASAIVARFPDVFKGGA